MNCGSSQVIAGAWTEGVWGGVWGESLWLAMHLYAPSELTSQAMIPTMWTAHTLEATPSLRRIGLLQNASPASYRAVIDGWRTDAGFRTWFNGQLASSDFVAFRWETPPVTDLSVDHPFQFVLLDAPSLARAPEPEVFAEHFRRSADGQVVTFHNLGRDAVLVVPLPKAEPSAYGHLAAFVRHAPEPQRDALWQAVGDAMAQRLGAKPVWLSTAGAGVAWLHVRLDDQPKYYGYRPFTGAIAASEDPCCRL